MLEYGVKNTVVERLRNLKVRHSSNEFSIEISGLSPKIEVVKQILSNVLDDINGLENLKLVNIDATHRRLLRRTPFSILKARASRERDVFKLSKIGGKAIQDGAGKPGLFVHGGESTYRRDP